MERLLHFLAALQAVLSLDLYNIGVLTQTSPSFEDYHREPKGDFRSIGQVRKAYAPTSSRAVYLPLSMPTAGLIYKIEVFLIATDPLFLQLWRPLRGEKNSFTLKNQLKIQNDRVNFSSTFYTITEQRDGPPLCPFVRRGDKIGIFTTANHLAVPVYYNRNESKMLIKRTDDESLVSPGETLEFTKVQFPFAFSMEVFLYSDNILRQNQRSGDFRPCPEKLLPKQSTTVPSTTTAKTRTTWPTISHRESSAEPHFTMAMTENQEMASAKVLHIAIGTLAGVAVIAIICAVVLALFCRRRHQQDESQTVAKSVANGVLGEESRCTPSAPTANPVYAVSCDIMNDYETTRHVRPQSAEFHSYVPVLPPRRRDREGNRSSGTYEEIQVARDEGDGKSATVAGSDHVTKPNGDYEVYGNAGYEDGDPDGNIQKHAPEEVSAYLTLVPNR